MLPEVVKQTKGSLQKADLHAVYIYLKKDNQILDINIHDHVAYNLKLHKIKLRRAQCWLSLVSHNAA